MDRYIEDELCGFTFTVNGFQTLFELIRRLQKQENLEKVPQNLPILMVSGAEDPVGDYGKGVHKACDSLKRAGVKNITVKLYENDRHELLNEDDAEVAVDLQGDSGDRLRTEAFLILNRRDGAVWQIW